MQTNGQTRKSLAEQIDRLDGILDGLADGLNEAVSTAVRDAVTLAVRQALQAVVAEVLSNPDLLSLLRGSLTHAASATVQPAHEPAERPAGNLLTRVGTWIRRQWTHTCQATICMLRLTGRCLATGWQLLRRFQGQTVVAVAIGTGAGVAAYFAGPWLATGAAWLGAFAAALATQVALGLRRALAAVSFPAT
jgi:hypothetical protein